MEVRKIFSKSWRINTDSSQCSPEIMEEFGLSPLIAKLLTNRKVTTSEEVKFFFKGGKKDLPCPFLLKGMDQAVDLFEASLKNKEKILIYGDYDVDGLTSVALILRTLRRYNTGNIIYYLPKRLAEGYGLHLQALTKAVNYGCTLVVTVDCGITACSEADYLAEKGVKLLLTDHHEPGEQLPTAASLVNPKLSPDYPYPQLAGVGVAFKLLQGLATRMPELEVDLWENIDLVALGTIADVVPLLGENRVLVKEGLKALKNTGNPGLRALMSQTGLLGKKIESWQVAYNLAPRLNACGRLGDPAVGLRLLLETNPDRARKVAELLEKMNRRRQNVEEQVLKEAEGMLATTDDVGKAIVLAGDWHPGVIGIVASRLAEKFYRPTVLLSIREEKAKGSARSIPGFHLFRALEKCASYLNTYGGHEFAAGVEVEKARLVDFKKAFLAVADLWLTNEMLTPCLEVEEVIEVAEVTKDLLNNLLQLAPFGAGNPEPILASRKVNIFSYNGVGKNAKHLKLKVGNEFARYEAIGFNYGSLAAQLEGIEWVDLAFNVTENDWNNQIQLVLKDLQPVAEVG